MNGPAPSTIRAAPVTAWSSAARSKRSRASTVACPRGSELLIDSGTDVLMSASTSETSLTAAKRWMASRTRGSESCISPIRILTHSSLNEALAGSVRNVTVLVLHPVYAVNYPFRREPCRRPKYLDRGDVRNGPPQTPRQAGLETSFLASFMIPTRIKVPTSLSLGIASVTEDGSSRKSNSHPRHFSCSGCGSLSICYPGCPVCNVWRWSKDSEDLRVSIPMSKDLGPSHTGMRRHVV